MYLSQSMLGAISSHSSKHSTIGATLTMIHSRTLSRRLRSRLRRNSGHHGHTARNCSNSNRRNHRSTRNIRRVSLGAARNPSLSIDATHLYTNSLVFIAPSSVTRLSAPKMLHSSRQTRRSIKRATVCISNSSNRLCILDRLSRV